MSRLAVAAAVVLALLAAALACGCGGGEGEPGPGSATATGERPASRTPAPGERPNIVAIVTDDQSLAQLNRETMPETMRLLADPGTTFSDFVVTTPLCCPSRATFLTGQYAHNNGVVSNSYRRLRDRANILPTWLRRAGYVTAHVGKYLNNFEQTLPRRAAVPAGWDEWHTQLEPQRYYGYELAENGEVVAYGERPDEYLTRVLNRRAVELIEAHAGGPRPLYLQLDQYAPHFDVGRSEPGCEGGPPPDPDDRGLLAAAPEPASSPAADERDVSDKPWFIRRSPALSEGERRRAETQRRCETAALRAVDRGVAAIVAALERAGALERTAIIFTSDNGAFHGEHRVRAKKSFPYEEAIRVPLIVRLPEASGGGGRAVERVDAPTANIDLAPTILELAGARPCRAPGRCRVLDGRSLLPLIRDPDPRWPRERAVLIELDQPAGGRRGYPRPCAYAAVRVARRVLIRHRSAAPPGGECEARPAVEHYDLERDPAQLDNLAAPGAGDRAARRERRALERRLRALRRCAGAAPPAGPPDRRRCE